MAGDLGHAGPEGLALVGPFGWQIVCQESWPTLSPCEDQMGSPSPLMFPILVFITGNNWGRKSWGSTKSAKFEPGTNRAPSCQAGWK